MYYSINYTGANEQQSCKCPIIALVLESHCWIELKLRFIFPQACKTIQIQNFTLLTTSSFYLNLCCYWLFCYFLKEFHLTSLDFSTHQPFDSFPIHSGTGHSYPIDLTHIESSHIHQGNSPYKGVLGAGWRFCFHYWNEWGVILSLFLDPCFLAKKCGAREKEQKYPTLSAGKSRMRVTGISCSTLAVVPHSTNWTRRFV